MPRLQMSHLIEIKHDAIILLDAHFRPRDNLPGFGASACHEILADVVRLRSPCPSFPVRL
jgi:hypothetical protein